MNEGTAMNQDQDITRHYWLREDFDELMEVIPAVDLPMAGDRDSSFTLTYPKTTKGAVAELRLRGLTCDEALLAKLADEGIVNPKRGQSLRADDEGNTWLEPSAVILDWNKDDIDAAAEWLYEHEYWNSWTHFCWVANLRYGQAVKAHRVTCARYQLGFSLGFDVPGLVTVIKPHKEEGGYARVQFYPRHMVVEPQKEVSQ